MAVALLLSGQVTEAVDAASKAANDIDSKVNGKLTDIRADFYDASDEIGGILYNSTLALYGVGMLLLILLLLFGGINCPAGIALFIAFLLIILVLYFVLSAIFAVVLAGEQEVCTHVEDTVIRSSLVDAKWQPLAK